MTDYSRVRRRKPHYENVQVKNGLVGIGQDYEQAYYALKCKFAKHYHLDPDNIEYQSKYVNHQCLHFIIHANIKHEFITVKSKDGRVMCLIESQKID